MSSLFEEFNMAEQIAASSKMEDYLDQPRFYHGSGKFPSRSCVIAWSKEVFVFEKMSIETLKITRPVTGAIVQCYNSGGKEKLFAEFPGLEAEWKARTEKKRKA
jgi:hypothetical protein